LEIDKRGDARAAAARLALAVHAYRGAIEAFVQLEWDPERYRTAADLFAHVEADAARLPAVQLEWLEVLISRFEFTHAWWEARLATKDTERLSIHQGRHLGALERLLAGCAKYGRNAQS